MNAMYDPQIEQELREAADPAAQDRTPGIWQRATIELPWMRSQPSCATDMPRHPSSLPAAPPAASSPTSYGCPLCEGAGFYKLRVPFGHPDFGRLFPCQCKLIEREQRDTQLLSALDQQLLRYRDHRLASFDLQRPLSGPLNWLGQVYGEAQQQAALVEALRIATSYVERPSGWLYLYGPPGSGKTHLAASIANEFRDRRIHATYGRTQALLDWLKAGFAEGERLRFDHRLRMLERAPLLLIDDLGTEYGTPWERVTLENLLNERYNRELPTVLTSNAWRDELPALIADRIAGMAQVIWLVVNSHRRIRTVPSGANRAEPPRNLDPWERGEGEQ